MPTAAHVVAITGASGAVYGLRLVGALLELGAQVDLTISRSGLTVIEEETGLKLGAVKAQAASIKAFIERRWGRKGRQTAKNPASRLNVYSCDDLLSPMASGSSLKRTMVVCPCSMGTLGRIASGVSFNLIDRAADAVLKEGGTLVLVPRETPLNQIHLENMLKVARAGAKIAPAMPAFYNKPETIDDTIDFVVGKILDLTGVQNDIYTRWRG
jgi:4-hydroxy-3-polyprenylbenzoate decarboxylase